MDRIPTHLTRKHSARVVYLFAAYSRWRPNLLKRKRAISIEPEHVRVLRTRSFFWHSHSATRHTAARRLDEPMDFSGIDRLNLGDVSLKTECSNDQQANCARETDLTNVVEVCFRRSFQPLTERTEWKQRSNDSLSVTW